MKQILSTLLILTIASQIAVCQIKKENNPWFVSKDKMAKKKLFYELSGGLSYSNMIFSNEAYGQLERKVTWVPDFGIGARYQMKKWFSITPRLYYSENSLLINNNDSYSFKSSNLNLSLPLDFQVILGKRNQIGTTKLFIYVGPYMGVPLSGKIMNSSYVGKYRIDKMNKPDYGINGGLGIRIPTFSLEGRSFLSLRVEYSKGLADTYFPDELAAGREMRDQFYLEGGKRYNGGIKFIVGIEIPKKDRKMISFTAGGDGKKNYKKIVIIDEK